MKSKRLVRPATSDFHRGNNARISLLLTDEEVFKLKDLLTATGEPYADDAIRVVLLAAAADRPELGAFTAQARILRREMLARMAKTVQGSLDDMRDRVERDVIAAIEALAAEDS
jgi:hypothetical protein